jgi:hypothetical protein
MPKPEGYCSECKQWESLDYFLYYRCERYDFCCLKCLYEFVCKEHKGEL